MQLLLYGFVPVLSLPMNMLCGMVMPLLLLGGWGVTLLSCLVFPVSVYAAQMLGCLARVFESINVTVAASRYAILRLPAPYGISILLTMGLMLLLSRRILLGSVRRRMALALSIVLALSYLPRFNPCARYVQLDVGQGDAAVVRSGRRAVLIDAGPADSYDALRYLRREGLFVDAVVLSHLDEDHAGALGVLLESEVEIPCVVMAEGAQNEEVSADVRAGLDLLEAQGVAIYEVRRGDMLRIGGLRMDVLAPQELRLRSNESSLLIHAQLAGTSFLMTGDLPQKSEPSDVPCCDVLKVAHHGSAKATSMEFLQKVQPSWALISVGRNNRYGHPGGRVLDALDAVGCEVLRTDESGCVTLWLGDGVRHADRFCGQ